MKTLIALLLIAGCLLGADWTVNDPDVIDKELVTRNGRLTSKVIVRFTPDAGEAQDFITYVRGADAMAQVMRWGGDAQDALQGHDGITTGTFTPVRVTPTEEVIADFQEAVIRKRALEGDDGTGGLKEVLGLADDDTPIGTTGLTVNTKRTALLKVINSALTNAARLNKALDAYPR